MHTLGFRFKPWIHDKSIADGPSIMEYLHETIEDYELKNNILLNHKVSSANWNSEKSIWELKINVNGKFEDMTCNRKNMSILQVYYLNFHFNAFSFVFCCKLIVPNTIQTIYARVIHFFFFLNSKSAFSQRYPKYVR